MALPPRLRGEQTANRPAEFAEIAAVRSNHPPSSGPSATTTSDRTRCPATPPNSRFRPLVSGKTGAAKTAVVGVIVVMVVDVVVVNVDLVVVLLLLLLLLHFVVTFTLWVST
jgi:hypothetical protein